MKFAFAAALLAFSQVQAVEVNTEAEWTNSYGGYGGYRSHGLAARATVARSYVAPARSYTTSYAYNGHGHHSYSAHSSSDYSSYDSNDYSLSDYGHGYRHVAGNNRYMRYTPKYNNNRYYYGNRYASSSGVYKGAYRSYGTRSYSACQGGCVRPASYTAGW